MAGPSLSIVIPVFRSERFLTSLVERLIPVLHSMECPHEIILVNDASPDQSWALIQNLAQRYSCIRGIDLMRNFGQQNALLCGIRAAVHEVIVTLDADLQHPPEEIPRLLSKLDTGFDLVYGVPEKEQHSLARNLSSILMKAIMKHVMGIRDAVQGSAFRAFRTCLRNAFTTYQAPFVSIDVLLSWGTSRFGALPVRHDPRPSGRSGYSFGKLVAHGFNIITGFSTFPLKLASLIGFFFTLFGIGVLLYVVGRYLILGYSFPGFPFLASIIAIFSGAQLFALGIMGEYLARIHFSTMERPPYVVRQTLDKKHKG